MSVTEIIDALGSLSPNEFDAVRDKIGAIRDDITPERIAAVEEGLRSSREERSYTLEEAREELRKWHSGSK